jgi:hypothetical protein
LRGSDLLRVKDRQLAHHELDGFGGIGEGMSIQIAKDGRRILWLAHESAPKNFTAVDVSDPRAPKPVARADLPQSHMCSNSLETVGDTMAVAYQTTRPGLQAAGFELFDISVPENPISTCPLPPLENFMHRGTCYEAHNLYENLPKPNAWKSDRIAFWPRTSMAACAPTTPPTPYQPARSWLFRACRPGAGAERGDLDKRRLRRRAADRLHRRPARRGALHA